MCYPDHYGILLVMKNIPLANRRNPNGEKFKMWNLNKEGGWKKFKELTEVNEKFKNIADENTMNPTQLMEEINKEVTKVKFRAFGKVTVRNDLKTNKELKTLQKEKFDLLKKKNSEERDDEIDALEDKITNEVLSTQRKKLEKELSELRDMKYKKGKSAVIFNLKDKIVGKKAAQEATTMKDPKTNKELTKRKDIKEAALSYCVDLLTNRSPKPGFEEDLILTDLIHEKRMRETIDDDVEFSRTTFENSLKVLEKKNKNKYEFILKGGNDFKESLFNLYSLFWDSEDKPDQWRKTMIIQLFKGKGEKNEFSNQRNIHTKLDVPKLFGHMVMSHAKGKIIANMTKFQIGTKTGHRAQEHLFTLKSVISLYLRYDFPVLIQLYDISKFFDRESLRDGMNAIYNCGIRGKLYRLIYNMNKDSKITVRTAVGETDEAETGENIGQGTLEGANISAANIDYTVNMFFKTSMDELSYGGDQPQPLLFQDDISRLATSVWGAQSGNDKMESVMETKLLDFNLDKSCVIVMGSEKRKAEIDEELKENPLKLCGQKMKHVLKEKYLGDFLSSGGLSDSVHATVAKRKGQVVTSILETKAVIEDCRSNIVGGITAGLEIWELAILPFLLNNSDTWVEITKSTIDILDDLQYMFYRYLLATPRTCPIPALLWETGGLLMEHRIAHKKLLFYHHLTNLPPNSLAYEIATTQNAMSYPGLMLECAKLMEKYELDDVKNYNKIQWKKLVKQKVTEKNRADLLDNIENNYKKLDHKVLKDENGDQQGYLKSLNLPDARLKFALRSKMTKTVQMNYKGEPKYIKNGWKCQDCDVLDTQDHVTRCPAYQQLRVGKNLSCDKDLVEYFRKIIQIRDKCNE